MAWSITRKATDEDREKLEKRAKAFAKRHDLSDEMYLDSWVEQVESEIEMFCQPDQWEHNQLEGKRMGRLWKRIANRAIGDDGIAYGHVGHSVD